MEVSFCSQQSHSFYSGNLVAVPGMEMCNVFDGNAATYLIQGTEPNSHLTCPPVEQLDAMYKEGALEFVVEQGLYYPTATNYGYICTDVFQHPLYWGQSDNKIARWRAMEGVWPCFDLSKLSFSRRGCSNTLGRCQRTGMDWSLEKIGLTIGIVKNLYDLTGQWVGNVINLDTNMETLKRKTEQLKGREEDINEDVNYKVLRSRKIRRADVELWQEDVRRIANDVQTLERQVQEVSWMNVYKRAKLGNRVVETIQEVGKQYENGEFSNRLLLDDPTCGHDIPTGESLVETTSVRNKEKIWNFLMDDAVRKIGVRGMGGVGKTTIMKHINNQLLGQTRNFSDVIWVTVPKTFEIKNLQRHIAMKLNLNLSDYEDELRSASEIHNMLSQKKRYVLILDNLSNPFPLEEVGIPEPTRDNGCKLVLTTRSLEVSRQMECINVEVERLTEDETLNLFMRNVKEHQTVLDPQVKETAERIAKKCARLPLVIVTVARIMKGVNEIQEWRNAEQIMDKEKGIFKRKVVRRGQGSLSKALRNIPDSFFMRMPRLKVWDLSCTASTAIKSLLESISKLENLHQLLLRDCHELECVPSLEKLKASEHFELTGSMIEEVPQEYEDVCEDEDYLDEKVVEEEEDEDEEEEEEDIYEDEDYLDAEEGDEKEEEEEEETESLEGNEIE